MASTSSSQRQKAFSGIEPPNKRRKGEESSKLYDVFINQRGPDVKQTLAKQLYSSLAQLGIRAFLDSEEMDLGNWVTSIIETAILSAKVHIAIFSKGFAESPWCLAQLVLMLESKAKIIPVFYDVEPWELRHIEQGVYADAFKRHEQKGRYLEKLSMWKEALATLSFISGVKLNSLSNWNCETIVAIVHKEVTRKTMLHVADYAVGLDNLVQDFERRCLGELVKDLENQSGLEEGKREAKVVGIFGMGGAGKTTLAKELFNRMNLNYNRASFLFDVREAAMMRQLPSLQLKLLKDLFDDNHLIFTSTEEGTSYLKDRLQRISVLSALIVVDDIDHVEQLDALLVMDILNKSGNSLVIVTTRDARVLINAGITVAYNLKGIDKIKGRELFCWHAFGQPYPCSGYELLVDNFADVCAGLPLSLRVLGRHVHGGSHQYWSSELIKVRKTLTREIKQRLRISFDALDDEEKQVFMDIACFFGGKPKSIAKRVIEGSGWNSQALERLKDKSFVQEIQSLSLNMEGEVVLEMHGHLRDLGREMALELSSPCRLWRPQDLKSLEFKGFKYILAQTNVRCLHSISDESTGFQFTFFFGQSDSTSGSFLWLQLKENSKEELCNSVQACSQWKELHINADVEAVGSMMKENELKEKISSLPEDLEFLRWDGFPLRNLPSWLGLRNLSVLELHGANELEELWEDKAHAPFHLRELIVTGTWSATFKRFPSSISYLNHLKKIALLGDVGKEFGIKGLPEEFCHLQSLEHLVLRHCTLLSSLPAGFGDLRSLLHLDLCYCKELRILPYSFKQLTQLQYLDLSGCEKLVLNKEILENIRKLENFYLSGCLKLRQLPDQITDQACLRELRLQDTRLDVLPLNIGQLSKLELLTIGSPFLTSLPVSIGDLSSLKSLSIIDCIDLDSLPETLGRLTLLEHLCIESSEVRSLPEGLIELNNLQTLKISGCPLSDLYFVSGSSSRLSNLRLMEISETCVARISIAEDCCPRLETLHISRNDNLKEIETLPTTVKNIELSECENLKTWKYKVKLEH